MHCDRLGMMEWQRSIPCNVALPHPHCPSILSLLEHHSLFNTRTEQELLDRSAQHMLALLSSDYLSIHSPSRNTMSVSSYDISHQHQCVSVIAIMRGEKMVNCQQDCITLFWRNIQEQIIWSNIWSWILFVYYLWHPSRHGVETVQCEYVISFSAVFPSDSNACHVMSCHVMSCRVCWCKTGWEMRMLECMQWSKGLHRMWHVVRHWRNDSTELSWDRC